MKTNQLEKVKKALLKLNNFRKNKADKYNKDGIRLFRLGEKDASIKEFKKALYLNPKFNKSLPKEEIAYSLALVHRSMDDSKKELQYYSKALYYNPRFYNGWFWKGRRYLALSDKISLMHNRPLKGRWFLSLNTPKKLSKEAIYCFTNAIRSSDDEPKPYYYSGCCYEKLGDSKKAVEMFDQVFELDSNFENLNKSRIFDKIKHAPADKKECPNCQDKVKPGDAFCADCGTALK
jgi:tetratricopeptide (TPR) repeat protein